MTNVNEARPTSLFPPLRLRKVLQVAQFGSLSSTDEDVGDTFTYSISGGADAASFTISGANLVTASTFDYETKSSYSVQVRSTDAGGASFTETFTVTVTDINEAPTDISISASAIAEGASGRTVGAFSSIDQDAGDTFTYAITGGADAASFTVSGANLVTAAAFDFNVKSSYVVQIRSTDSGSLTFSKSFTITVTNVNDAPTNISISASSIAEGASGRTVGAFTTTDPDAGDTFTYSITGGADAASFTISGANLVTASAFDYETKTSYSVQITSTDAGSLTFAKSFTITVVNANEAPTNISISASSIAEGASGRTVGSFTSTDQDAGDTFTYAITGGADSASFSISGANLVTAATFDFETKNSYAVQIRTTDAAGLTYYKKLYHQC